MEASILLFLIFVQTNLSLNFFFLFDHWQEEYRLSHISTALGTQDTVFSHTFHYIDNTRNLFLKSQNKWKKWKANNVISWLHTKAKQTNLSTPCLFSQWLLIAIGQWIMRKTVRLKIASPNSVEVDRSCQASRARYSQRKHPQFFCSYYSINGPAFWPLEGLPILHLLWTSNQSLFFHFICLWEVDTANKYFSFSIMKYLAYTPHTVTKLSLIRGKRVTSIF